MTHRVKYVDIDGEPTKIEESIMALCDCRVDPHTKKHFWSEVPYNAGEDDAQETCKLCGGYIFWGTFEELSSNERR